MLSLHADVLAVLDAICDRHGLRGRSEAVRHVCAALAPVYGCKPVTVVRLPGRPSVAYRRAILSHEDLRAIPAEARHDFVVWFNEGLRPSDAAIAASGLPPERIAAILAACSAPRPPTKLQLRQQARRDAFAQASTGKPQLSDAAYGEVRYGYCDNDTQPSNATLRELEAAGYDASYLRANFTYYARAEALQAELAAANRKEQNK